VEAQVKRLFVIALLFAVLAGCDGIEIRFDERPLDNRRVPAVPTEYPTVNLPVALRQANWRGDEGEGSCVHASMISLFRWQGRYATADYWRRTYGNGEWATSFAQKLERDGIRYAYTVGQNDVDFLEWACRTRRGAGVTVLGGRHMVCLVHLDEKWAGILDNNSVERIQWVPRKTFLAEWRHSNSWGVTPIYSPAPPLPSY
jgi:hypothetical protein